MLVIEISIIYKNKFLCRKCNDTVLF